VRFFRYGYWFPGQKQRDTILEMAGPTIEDEKVRTSQNGLRRRKKGKKENRSPKRGGHVQDDDNILLKEHEGPPKRGGPRGVNMYDLAKILAVTTCIIDHYGYFGIPGIPYTTARWTRVIGRMAAPLFFYLAGYSNKFRFRWHSWCWAVLLFVVNAWLGLHLTATSWDSMNTILTINWLFSYIKWEKHLGSTFKTQLFFHIPMMALALYFETYVNDEWKMAYGTLPYMFAIGAQLVNKGQFMGKVWILVASVHYAIGSYNVFGRTPAMTMSICAVVTINCLMFMFFDKLSKFGEFKFFNRLGLVKDLMLYISRKAIIVYVVHLMIFRLIQLTKWNW